MKGLSSAALAVAAVFIRGAAWILVSTPMAPPASEAVQRARNPRRPHTGILQPVGSHFLEANTLNGGRLRITLLDADETTLLAIPADELTVELPRLKGTSPASPVRLKAVPQPGEPAGRASTFEGQIPPTLDDVPVQVSLSLPSDQKVVRVSFTAAWHLFEPTLGASGNGMPSAVPAADAQKLYLTPGGRYTAADIEANGRTTGPLKYAGFQALHNTSPRPGQRICPITKTVANPRVTWIIGGKKYLFCCPPCVDEFLKRAKKQPSAVKSPESYVQR